MTRETRLAAAVVDLTRTIVEDVDIVDFLQAVATRTGDVFAGSTALVLLADHRGSLRPVGVSPPAADLPRLLEVARGPAMRAYAVGESIAGAGLDADGAWPATAHAARALGLRQVAVAPLRFLSAQLGALVVLSPRPRDGHDDPAATEVLGALGGVATLGLLRERSPREREQVAEQMQTALTLRVVVEQATGMVAEVAGVPVDVAFTMIQQHAHRIGRTLGATAQRVVADRGLLTALPDPTGGAAGVADG